MGRSKDHSILRRGRMICLPSLLDLSRICASGRRVFRGTPGFEVYGGKHSRRSGPDEEAQKSSVVITIDSLERAFGALSALEGAS